MVQSKRGDHFLVDSSIKELQQSYKKEQNPKSQLRLLAAILRKQGKTIDAISSSLQKPRSTISDWLRVMENRGLAGKKDIKQPGKPSKLKEDQLQQLKNVLSDSPQKQGLPFTLWTTKLVQYIILKLFNIKYELRNVIYVISKLNFVLRVPRQRNHKASAKAQEEFKKKLRQKYNIILNTDLRSFVLMKHTLK